MFWISTNTVDTFKVWFEIEISPEFQPVVVREIGLKTDPLEKLTLTRRAVEFKSSVGHRASAHTKVLQQIF